MTDNLIHAQNGGLRKAIEETIEDYDDSMDADMNAIVEDLRTALAKYPPEPVEKRIPLKIEFDFENTIDAFGATILKDGESLKDGEVRHIIINAAAILWACAEEPELSWKEFMADTILHEVLHDIQDALCHVLKEDEVEDAVERARASLETEPPQSAKEEPK